MHYLKPTSALVPLDSFVDALHEVILGLETKVALGIASVAQPVALLEDAELVGI